MRVIVSICAVIVTGIASYFFIQDRIDRTGWKSEAQLRRERVDRELERMEISREISRKRADILDKMTGEDWARLTKDEVDRLMRTNWTKNDVDYVELLLRKN